jgi:hypothetical protein
MGEWGQLPFSPGEFGDVLQIRGSSFPLSFHNSDFFLGQSASLSFPAAGRKSLAANRE